MLTVVENKAQEDAACSLDERAREGARRMLQSAIFPPYMRRSPKVSEVLPVLYLRGLSTGDFRPALRSLLGNDAA